MIEGCGVCWRFAIPPCSATLLPRFPLLPLLSFEMEKRQRRGKRGGREGVGKGEETETIDDQSCFIDNCQSSCPCDCRAAKKDEEKE
jgi:hypothetical protein